MRGAQHRYLRPPLRLRVWWLFIGNDVADHEALWRAARRREAAKVEVRPSG